VRQPGDILIVSCYELGRQPVAAATALAELRRAGFEPAALDVSVEAVDEAALRRARLVAVSVPMHTALRLGVRLARRAPPGAHVCFFGVYAELNAQHLLERHAHSVIGGEADVPLRLLAESLERGDPGAVPGVRTALGACVAVLAIGAVICRQWAPETRNVPLGALDASPHPV